MIQRHLHSIYNDDMDIQRELSLSPLDYTSLVHRVRSWGVLNKRLTTTQSWNCLSKEEKKEEIIRTLVDLKTYFYCPDCERKFLIKDAIVKERRMIQSFSLSPGPIILPGWWKMQTSYNSYYLRLCEECATTRSHLRKKIYFMGSFIIPIILSILFIIFMAKELNFEIFIFFAMCFGLIGSILSSIIIYWIEKEKHPNEYSNALTRNALGRKEECLDD